MATFGPPSADSHLRHGSLDDPLYLCERIQQQKRLFETSTGALGSLQSQIHLARSLLQNAEDQLDSTEALQIYHGQALSSLAGDLMGMDLPGSTMFGVQLDGDPALAAAQALSHFQQYWTFTNTMARARTAESESGITDVLGQLDVNFISPLSSPASQKTEALVAVEEQPESPEVADKAASFETVSIPVLPAGESEDIIGQKSLVVDADDVPASSSSSSLSDSPTSTPARANIAASSLAPAKRASSTAFELSMSFAQGQAQQAPVLQKDMPSVSSTSEELENWLQDYQPKPPAAREAVLITSSAYGKLVTWDSSSAGQLGEQESFKPLIVSRISSYGNVRTALMLQWLDNHSKTWSGMRKVNLGTHRWHLVDVLEPVFEAQARAGKPMQIRVGGKDGLDLIGIKCKNAAGRPGHEDSTAPWGIGVAISIDALAIMGDPELFAIVLNDWAGILGGGIPALAQPFPRIALKSQFSKQQMKQLHRIMDPTASLDHECTV